MLEMKRNRLNGVIELISDVLKGEEKNWVKATKSLFKVESARVLLLEIAKDYLDHSELEEGTDKRYGKGITKSVAKLETCKIRIGASHFNIIEI